MKMNHRRGVVNQLHDIKTKAPSKPWDQFRSSPEGCLSGVRRAGGVILFQAFS